MTKNKNNDTAHKNIPFAIVFMLNGFLIYKRMINKIIEICFEPGNAKMSAGMDLKITV